MICVNPNRVPLNDNERLPLRYRPEPGPAQSDLRHVEPPLDKQSDYRTLAGGTVGSDVLAVLERVRPLPPAIGGWGIDGVLSWVVVHTPYHVPVVVGEFGTLAEAEAAYKLCASYLLDASKGRAHYNVQEVRRAA